MLRISSITFVILIATFLVGAFASVTFAQTASDPGALSDIPAGATPFSDFERQALACRDSQFADELLKVGHATAGDRAVLGLGTTALTDWCVYLKTHLDNAPQHVEGLNPGFGQCLARFFQAGDASGARLTVSSGYRSPERQAELFNAAVEKYGSVSAARVYVAPPPCEAGTDAVACGNGSMHQRGLAADLRFNGQGMPANAAGVVACNANSACKWAHDNAAAFGLDFRIRQVEVWHIEPASGSCIEAGMKTVIDGGQTPSGSDTPAENALTPIVDLIQGIAGGASGGDIQNTLQDVVGNFFTTVLGGAEQTGAQQAFSLIPNQGTNNTSGGSQFLVLSEDGNLVTSSNVSAQDALTQATAFFNVLTMSPQNQTSLGEGLLGNLFEGGTNQSLEGQSIGGLFGNFFQTMQQGNTFDQSGTPATTSTSGIQFGGGVFNSESGNGEQFVQMFIQTIFGILGNILSSLGIGR